MPKNAIWPGMRCRSVPIGNCNHITVLPEVFLKTGSGYQALLEAIS